MVALGPHINVTLNALNLIFLSLAFLCIKEKKVKAHIFFIGLSLITSTAFLISYLYYHFHVGHVVYEATDFKKSIYLAVLTIHLILCVLLVPLIPLALKAAVQKNWGLHRRLAPIAFITWILNSLTGILIYFMVYW